MSSGAAFRTAFNFVEHVNWYPGHMLKSMREIGARLSQCHAVLEVRDARLPVSSANANIGALIRGKKRIVFFNKSDLIEREHSQSIARSLASSGARCVFGSTFDERCASTILAALTEEVLAAPAAPLHGAAPSAEPTRSKSQHVVAIVGMPNVGKSSVINALRRHAGGRSNAVRVGAQPGLTRNVSGIRVCDSPPMLVLDTPGVLVPATRLEPLAGLKLALASCIKETAVDPVVLVDLLLFLLNQPSAGAARFSYQRVYGLDAPTDDVDEFIAHVGRRQGVLGAGGRVNESQVASHVLAQYRAGKFGRLLLDTL